MASLFKRQKKDGRWIWHVTYYLNGRHHTKSTSTSDKKVALEVLKKVEEDCTRIAEGLEPADKITPILLSEFTDVYLEERRKQAKADRTITTDEYALRRLADYAGDCALTSVTENVVKKYRDHLLQQIKGTSVAIEFRHLKAAFSWAKEKPGSRYLRENPFKQKGLIPSSTKRMIPLCLSPEEKAKFLNAVDKPVHKQLFQFMLMTGCRRSEAIRLNWVDISLAEKQITFRRTKSGHDRTVPINIELMQIVVALDRTQPRPFPYHPDWVTHLFKRYLRKTGIKKDFHLHCLRHTTASDLVRQGIHLTKIAKFLGHSSTKTTEIYTHVIPEDLREVAEVLTCVG